MLRFLPFFVALAYVASGSLQQTSKITNGFRASSLVAKSMVYITYRYRGRPLELPTCSGVVLSSLHILTTAHCFYRADGPYANETDMVWYAYVGHKHKNESIHNDTKLRHKVRRIAAFTGYNVSEIRGDIAILTLKYPLEIPPIRPVILSDQVEDLVDGSVLHAAGFGETVLRDVGTRDDSGYLNQVTLQYYNRTRCEEYSIAGEWFSEHNEHICAKNPKHPEEFSGTCYGDSGGPLFKMINDSMVVYGLVASGDWECLGDMGYFPNIRKYARYIRNFMAGHKDKWDIIFLKG